MENSGRHIPPSNKRIAAATKAGFFAGAPLLAAGTVLIAGTWSLKMTGGLIVETMLTLVRRGFSNAFELRPSMDTAIQDTIRTGLASFLPVAGVCFAAAAAACIIPALATHRKGGRTVVPLPAKPSTKLVKTIIALFALAICTLIALHIFKSVGSSPASLTKGTTGDIQQTASLILSVTAASGVVMVLAGIVQSATNKAAAFKALHLTSAEARTEARATGGGKTAAAKMHRRDKKEHPR